MSQDEMTTIVGEVVAAAKREFGRRVEPGLLERWAHQAVAEIGRSRPRLTTYVADLALGDLRDRAGARPTAYPTPMPAH